MDARGDLCLRARPQCFCLLVIAPNLPTDLLSHLQPSSEAGRRLITSPNPESFAPKSSPQNESPFGDTAVKSAHPALPCSHCLVMLSPNLKGGCARGADRSHSHPWMLRVAQCVGSYRLFCALACSCSHHRSRARKRAMVPPAIGAPCLPKHCRSSRTRTISTKRT